MTIDEYMEKYTAHHQSAEVLAARLDAAGASDRAARITQCGTYTTGFVCPDCGEFHVYNTRLCRDRLCPNCGWTLARKRALATMRALNELRACTDCEVYHMVLTIQHERHSDLKTLLRTLTQGYGKLLRSDLFKHSLGSARSVEITFHEEHGFHPHIHAVVAMPKAAPPISVEAVRREWKELLAADYEPQVHYEAAFAADGSENTAEAVFEACKYAIKPQLLEDCDGATLLYFAEAVKGARLSSADGLLRFLIKQQRDADCRTITKGCAACASTAKQIHRALSWNYDRGLLCEGRPY